MKTRHFWMIGFLIAALATWGVAQTPIANLPSIGLGANNWTGIQTITNGATGGNLLQVSSTASATTRIQIGNGNAGGFFGVLSSSVIDVASQSGIPLTFTTAAEAMRITGALVTNAGMASTGTKFTASGCSNGTTVGGATAGRFTLGANTCSVVITMNGATGLTAANGWHCSANDRTAPTVLIGESTDSTTTATLNIPAGAGATDVIDFGCIGY